MAQNDVLDIENRAAPVLETDADGRLHYSDSRAGFTRLDRSYIAAAATAFREGRDIALIYPSPPTFVQLPVLLAVGYQCRGDSSPALFVSNRSGVREQYFNLGIGPRHSAPGIDPHPLGDMTAPMVRTGDGRSASYITGHKPEKWQGDPEQAAIIHTNFGKKLARTCELPLSGLILDFTTGLLDDKSVQDSWEQIAEEEGIPRIMVFDSPSHDYLERLEHENQRRQAEGAQEILFWGWSHNELEQAPSDLLSPVADIESASTDGDTTGDADTLGNPFEDPVGPLQNISNGIDREVIRIPHGDLEESAYEAWERIGETGQALREADDISSFAHGSVANAYFIYSYLDTLLTSVDYHDSLMRLDDTESWGSGKTIQHKINSLRKRQGALESELLGVGEQLADSCDALERMTEGLREHNPKADELATQIEGAVEEDRSVTVLASTRKQESITRSFITERTQFSGDALSGSGVEFHSLYNPHTIPESDILLFPGVPTQSHYPALLAGAGSEHRFLLYDWTLKRFKRRLENVLDMAEWRSGGGPQHHLATELGLSRGQLEEYTISAEPRAPQPLDYSQTRDETSDSAEQVDARTSDARAGGGSRIGESDSVSPDDISLSLGDLESSSGDDDFWNAEQEFDSRENKETINPGRSVVDASSNDQGEVEALKIELTDDSYIYEQPAGLLWKLDRSSSQLGRTRVAASSLEGGDEVIIIREDSRRDIFEHIVEKIHSESRGQFQDYLSMLDLWVTGVDQIMDRLAPNEEQRKQLGIPEGKQPPKRVMADWICEDLKQWNEENDRDPTRTSQQITKWLTKETLGPSEPAVIEALGEIYDIESLKSHPQQIFRGLKEVRSLHVRVGMNLNKILFQARDEDADDWLLKECGLRIGDVQDVTDVKTVAEVSSERQEISTHKIGRLYSSD